MGSEDVNKIKMKLIRKTVTVILGTGLGLAAAWHGLGRYLGKFTSKPKRIDKEGKLYLLDYYGNYDSALVKFPIKLVKPVRDAACSCIFTKDEEGNYITGRNFDLPHFDKNGNRTGLNVVIRCAPKSGYKSIAIADAAFVSVLRVPYYSGSLDKSETDKRYLALLPYLCMDGVNEKGLFVTVLALDTKKGEHPVYQKRKGKEQVIISVLLRKILDNCVSCEDAVSFADKFNLVNTLGHDFHLFISDVNGISCVLEWRYDVMTVTHTDIATNFYVSSDDAEDCYLEGELKEKFTAPDKANGYRFGYGHGYERFKTLMRLSEENKVDGNAVMNEERVMEALKTVSQEYTGELTSMTQYSAVYNNREKKIEVCIYPDYNHKYNFML